MHELKVKELRSGYASEVDTVDEHTWCQLLERFDDANIYQTWSYDEVRFGRRNISHLLLKNHGEIVAIAQSRIVKLPFINIGIAYIRWGPLWRLRQSKTEVEVFRQMIRALRNEYASRRSLVLRLLPVLFDTDPAGFVAILKEEGFSSLGAQTRSRTILMDITPSLKDLYAGMRPHWKRELKIAERKRLEVVEGTGDELFGSVIEIHKEMVSRKRFVEGNDINQFRVMQARLPEHLKMRIMICKSTAGICAGLIWSAIGNTALYLFGATSNIGMKSNGSYLLQWKLIEQLKKDGCTVYDLNGINPEKNPGTYKFKSDLAGEHGKDVYFLGRFESHCNGLSHLCIKWIEKLGVFYRGLWITPGNVH